MWYSQAIDLVIYGKDKGYVRYTFMLKVGTKMWYGQAKVSLGGGILP